jgi:hypothetical protein
MTQRPSCILLVIGLLVVTTQADPVAAAAIQQCLPAGDGQLSTSISGALALDLDWDNEGTTCTGAGNRYLTPVEFSRTLEGGGTLVITLRIKGLPEGETGAGLASTVSITGDAVEMGMFETGDGTCSIDVTEHELVQDGPERLYRVSGSGQCSTPVKSKYDDRVIEIGPFEFVGATRWSQ